MLDEGTLTFNSEPDVKKVCGNFISNIYLVSLMITGHEILHLQRLDKRQPVRDCEVPGRDLEPAQDQGPAVPAGPPGRGGVSRVIPELFRRIPSQCSQKILFKA